MHCLAGLDMGRHSVMLRQPALVLRQYSVSLGCSFVNVGCYKYGCATQLRATKETKKNVDPGNKEDEGQIRDAARRHSNMRRRAPGRGPASC